MQEDPLQYIKDIQSLSWRDLGYSSLMRRELNGDPTSKFMGGSDFAAYVEDGGLEELLRKINPNALLDTSLVNSKIKPSFRGATAVVALSGGDFASLQPAIDYVHSVGGGTILIKAGTYIITSNITMYSNIYIVGEDATATILDLGSTTNQFSCSGISNIGFENMTIQNGRSTTGAINISNVTNGNLETVNFKNNDDGTGTGYDLYLNNLSAASEMITVSRCTSTSAGTFVYLNNVKANCSFVYNKILNPVSYAFRANTGNTQGGLFLGNDFVNPIKSCFFGEFTYSRITENYFEDTTGVMTQYFMDFSNSAQQNVLSGNVINRYNNATGGGGIRITGSANFQIIGNKIFVAGGHGILLDGSQTICISANNILANGSNVDGIQINNDHGTPIANQITGNYIDVVNGASAARDGIRLDDALDTVIMGNWVRGELSGTAYGVNITNIGCTNTVVVGNRLTANTAKTNDVGTASVIANNS